MERTVFYHLYNRNDVQLSIVCGRRASLGINDAWFLIPMINMI